MKSSLNRSGIYLIESPSGGQYIGSAVNLRLRWHGHRALLRKGTHSNRKLQNAWNKYGEDAMKFSVLLICAPEALLLYEQSALNAFYPRYNICRIAGNSLGVKWSGASKRKQSERVRGTKHSAETRAKRSASLRGREVSLATRTKLAAQKGWRHTDEAKAKMRGLQRSDAHREAIGRANRGNGNRLGAVVPQEMRDRIAAKLRGRKLSDETRAKMSATRRLKAASK